MVRSIRAVRRHEGRRGRLLDVLVEWEGENSDADLLDRTWRINGPAGHVAYRNDRIVPLCGPTSGREEVRSGGAVSWSAPGAGCESQSALGGPNGGRGAANATQRHTQVSDSAVSERHVAGSPLG